MIIKDISKYAVDSVLIICKILKMSKSMVKFLAEIKAERY
jgi:hypothetical protein